MPDATTCAATNPCFSIEARAAAPRLVFCVLHIDLRIQWVMKDRALYALDGPLFCVSEEPALCEWLSHERVRRRDLLGSVNDASSHDDDAPCSRREHRSQELMIGTGAAHGNRCTRHRCKSHCACASCAIHACTYVSYRARTCGGLTMVVSWAAWRSNRPRMARPYQLGDSGKC